MRSRTRNWIQTGLLLAVLAGSQTGCKSGWKMPSSDMFSWGRKPSESTIVGGGPSVTAPGSAMAGNPARPTVGAPTSPNGPLSPASRSTPNQVASTAVNPGGAVRPAGTQFGGYGPNGASPYGANAGAMQSPGAAASANGYTTGAYATNQTRPPLNTAPAPYGQSINGATPPSYQNQQFPNASPQIPLAQGGVPLPTSTPNQSYPPAIPAPQAYSGMPVPQGPSTVAGVPGGGLPPASVPNGYNMMQPQGSMGAPVARSSAPGYTPTGSQGLPAVPVSSGGNLPPGLPPSNQMPMAYGGTAPSSSMPTMTNPAVTNPAVTGSSPYRPGSVGRNTPYDFSNQGAGANPSAPATGFPRTANDPTGTMNR